MKLAVRTALAYAHVTGRIPKGIHIATWSAVNEAGEDGRSPIEFRAKEEFVSEIKDHPFLIGDAVMREKGLKPKAFQKSTTHSIVYVDGNGNEGGVSRDGSAWIWRWFDDDGRPLPRPYKHDKFNVMGKPE
jgi:hypothetical protein